jgi:hypothetical protein
MAETLDYWESFSVYCALLLGDWWDSSVDNMKGFLLKCGLSLRMERWDQGGGVQESLHKA